jgi:cyclase
MSSLSSDITVPGRPEVQEVSAGVYAYVQPDGTWWINNTGFLTGPQGVISVDACSTERRTRAYQAAIAAVTPAPVRTVLNTHHHGDHTFGNCLFPGAAIVAHERARAEAIAFGPPRELPFWDGPDWGDLSLDPPFVTFTDQIAVHAGDLRADVRHVGTAAHTTNDSIVWIPDRSVLFCGDLIFNGGTPFLARRPSCPATDRCSTTTGPSTRHWTTSGSCSTWRARPWPRGCRRWTRPGTPTWAGSRTGRTPSGSSATCTGPAPNSPGPPAAGPSTSRPRWPTWSPTTAARRSRA